MSRKETINKILENFDRKLLLIKGEKKSSKREEIIESLMFTEVVELRKELNFVFRKQSLNKTN